ncbi:pectate lyase-like protein [Frondihabitans sp. PhB188]|uniref:glycosyl hydrolase family 28-related protein n=1 Tax=Frondihabitans sp. PhB188 TaxID=2485200 RepID=UPI000F47189A|nr:glycosyl hydrolase family 28-related protein [Frondihabitans sp. PhB188]ROQ39835.1 pectate lyase-like protein [Frondihabitans sp. PhB188]
MTSDRSPSPHGRRGFLAAAALTTAAGITAVAASPASAAPTPGKSGQKVTASMFDVTDFGAVGDRVTDDTVAFQAAIQAAHAKLGVVLIPSGHYIIDSLTIPTLVKIIGEGADSSRFTPSARGGVNLHHRERSVDPLLVIDGGAITVEFITLHGNGSRAPLIRVDNGFESRINRVRLFDVPGTAIQINRVNNNTWTDLFIDNCGSRDAAAMVVTTPDDPTKQTNTFTCYNLTIERAANVALDIAWDGHGGNVVEFVRLPFLHVESPADEHSAFPGNVDPLIRLGNVRQLELTDAFVYGGPAPLLVHRQNLTLTEPLSGGIRLIGGAFLGADARKTGGPSETLIQLERGDDFAVVGTRFARFERAAVTAGDAYGARVLIDPTSTAPYSKTLLADDRDSADRPTWIWPGRIRASEDVILGRHLRSDRALSKPQLTPLPGAGTAPPSPTLNGTDTSGFLYFGTGTLTVRGGLVRVTYDKPFDVTPAVVITPTGSGAATRPFYVSPSRTHFDIGLAEVPPQGVTKTGFGFTYQVIG